MLPIRATYIWIDGSKPTAKLRSKTKIMPAEADTVITGVEAFPDWLFDGSSTNQATGDKSDCLLKPVCFVPDPIREGELQHYSDGGVELSINRNNAYLVLCEVYNIDGTPHPSNTRAHLRAALDAGAAELDAWFGFEQEYTFFKGSRPLGFPGSSRFPAAQGPYYCGVGADEVYGREVVEDHLLAMLQAGIACTGINAEVMPGQWEFQIGGPDQGPLIASDHLWLARWLLYRIGEDHGITATLDAKPVGGDWNGAGMHTNYSTRWMRWENKEEQPDCPVGMEAIEAACEAFRGRMKEHLAVYGDNYEARLTGNHETCRFDEFRYGVSDRTASIRIPAHVAAAGCGYMEDRRPNGNADPYEVATVMLETTQGI